MSQTKKPRDWTVLAAEYATEEDYRRAVTEELAGLENIGYRTGGAFIATPLRKLVPVDNDGLVGLPEQEYVVVGWLFQQVFMPAGRPVEPEAPTEDEEPSAEAAASSS